MLNVTLPLRGAHFRKEANYMGCPGKPILQFLPSGQALVLVPEPTNPFDPEAILVGVDPEDLPESVPGLISNLLPEYGIEPEEFWQHHSSCSSPCFFSYIGKEFTGALHEVLRRGGGLKATLTFDPAGKPLAEIMEEPTA